MTFNTWKEYKAYLESLPTNKLRIDALFNDDIVCLEDPEGIEQCSLMAQELNKQDSFGNAFWAD